MGQLVQPYVYLVGYTVANMPGLEAYLKDTNQEQFLEDWKKAKDLGISDGEALCSFYAKLCYKSLVPEQNANVTKIRDIPNNIKGTFNSGHGSVFEHASINFIATNVSRVYTHELVRHRPGFAFSQTAGRFCRLDEIDLIADPIMEDCYDLYKEAIKHDENIVYQMECRKGLRKPPTSFPQAKWDDWHVAGEQQMWVPNNDLDFDYKKRVTSAIRRIAPNGQSNEIGFSINFRAIRHYVQMRSSKGAEWEMRNVTHQIFHLLRPKYPLLFHGATATSHEGLDEITGMKLQPYEIDCNNPEALSIFSLEHLRAALDFKQQAVAG